MVRDYWRRVFAYAWQRSVTALGFGSKGRIVTAIFSALAVVAVLLFWGSQDAAGDMALERGTLWGLTIMAFPFVYMWYFFRAPAEMDLEKKNEITGLNHEIQKYTAALAQKTVSQINIRIISVLLEEGYALSVERLTSERFEVWVQEIRNWEFVTLKFIATVISHQDAVTFKTVRYNTRENFIFKIHEDHNHELQTLTARLNILRDIVSRFKQDWAPLSKQEKGEIKVLLDAFKSEVLASDGNKALNEEGG